MADDKDDDGEPDDMPEIDIRSCPHCDMDVVPDATGCCPECGGVIAG